MAAGGSKARPAASPARPTWIRVAEPMSSQATPPPTTTNASAPHCGPSGTPYATPTVRVRSVAATHIQVGAQSRSSYRTPSTWLRYAQGV